jgi:hypothetical protein
LAIFLSPIPPRFDIISAFSYHPSRRSGGDAAGCLADAADLNICRYWNPRITDADEAAGIMLFSCVGS